MEYVYLKVNELKFTKIKSISSDKYKIIKDLPVLIDKDKNVLIGNSARFFLPNTVKCLIIDTFNLDFMSYFNSLEEQCINEFEDKNYFIMAKEFKRFENTFKEKEFDHMMLFEKEKNTGLITSENYTPPPFYDFKKNHKKDIKDEEELYANLFVIG